MKDCGLPWNDWTIDVACWIADPVKGRQPYWRRLLPLVRRVRAKPFRNNPWRRYYARYGMTPWEAFETMRKS